MASHQSRNGDTYIGFLVALLSHRPETDGWVTNETLSSESGVSRADHLPLPRNCTREWHSHRVSARPIWRANDPHIAGLGAARHGPQRGAADMIQLAHPLASDVPLCGPGHHPRRVETRGAPLASRASAELPCMWHIECTMCGMATVPHTSRAITEMRWTSDDVRHRVPLSRLSAAREIAYRDAVAQAQQAA